jgi:hypothetical protein
VVESCQREIRKEGEARLRCPGDSDYLEALEARVFNNPRKQFSVQGLVDQVLAEWEQWSVAGLGGEEMTKNYHNCDNHVRKLP